MPVSSNTLFHFTSNNNFFGILEGNFIPKYSLESFQSDKITTSFGFPMVCFCDIRLSQIKRHLKVYGYYGIGFTKEWGISNGLNPILYLEEKSKLSYHLLKLLSTISKTDSTKNSELDKDIGKVLMHLKQVQGTFKYHGRTYYDYYYYDEREWRYIPEPSKILNEENYQIKAILDNYNEEISSQKLIFTPDDIKYLIIHNEREIDLLIEKLKIVKRRYTDNQINKLISRIITVDQIIRDF